MKNSVTYGDKERINVIDDLLSIIQFYIALFDLNVKNNLCLSYISHYDQ